MKNNKIMAIGIVIAAAIFINMTVAGKAFAHCDTLDGPVVIDAKAALASGDVKPVLKWVGAEDEKEIREIFAKTLKARKQGAEAKELAEMYFFETLVRVHRAGEGFPYKGLKPAGTDPGPAVKAADKAIETGSVEGLAEDLSSEVKESIKRRFNRVIEIKKHAAESVADGREFVEAYVSYVHYVENLHGMVSGPSGHHGSEQEKGPEASHAH
ncbi:MAG: hypothetical protein HZB23_04490 [Deltaproteobacteria bacterium]|nr:hypothetical protein [Deltaproteobacteria bacterium]